MGLDVGVQTVLQLLVLKVTGVHVQSDLSDSVASFI